ncbi:MAG: helix-turn-helix domain-containing protein [Chitinispirillales bacterium]|jgi:transcriptional regulator with XRE-family HTH domain|nr:helix-turn-helix domain-containing protein [Chitinispirillales bacterium]
MPTTTTTIGDRIKFFRKSLKLTQIDFGQKIGIVQGHLTGLETGKKKVTEKTIKVLCGIYGISEEWLRTGKGDMLQETETGTQQGHRFVYLFKELEPEYQDFILSQIESLVAVQKNRKIRK